MVGIALIAIASSVIGIKTYKAVQKKRFNSTLERLQARILVAQKLAISMQADWHASLQKKGKTWIFETICEEKKRLSPLRFQSIDIYLNGKKVQSLTLDFYATGEVLPDATLLFKSNSEKAEWKISDLISREEGKKLGPLHPAD